MGAKKKLVCQISVCLENWGLYMIPFDYEPTEAASFNKGQQKNWSQFHYCRLGDNKRWEKSMRHEKQEFVHHPIRSKNVKSRCKRVDPFLKTRTITSKPAAYAAGRALIESIHLKEGTERKEYSRVYIARKQEVDFIKRSNTDGSLYPFFVGACSTLAGSYAVKP